MACYAWHQTTGEGPRVLSVGHTRPYKNIETLLRALATTDMANVTLVRCGAPLMATQQRLATELGLDDRLIQLGHCEPAELRAVYSACDVLVQPSRAEGFGVPVIEAMACELPVVCSDAEALQEVAGGAASIVPMAGLPDQDAAVSLAAALAEVINDRSLSARLSCEGLKRASAFAPEKVISKLTAAYQIAVKEFTE